MDSQKVFDQVAEHLARQKQAAVNENGKCALRGTDNTKCAFGCLIPDYEYLPGMEEDSGLGIHSLHDAEKSLVKNLMAHSWVLDHLDPTTEEFTLLRELQICHDDAVGTAYHAVFPTRPIDLWPTSLDAIAQRYSLQFNRSEFERKLVDPSYCYPKA